MTEKEQESTFEVRDRRRFRDSEEEAGPEVASSGETDRSSASTGEPAAPSSGGEEQTPEASPRESSNAAGSNEESASEERAADHSGEETTGADETPFGMPDISVADMLQFTVASLAQMAWQNMGLLSNPATGKVETRLEDARLGIDAIAALLQVLQPRMDEGGKREAQTLLSNLRLNFVEQSRRRAN